MNSLATGLTALKNDLYLHMQASNPELLKGMKGNDFERMLVVNALVLASFSFVVIKSIIVVVSHI